jgi:hypothetical protein
MSDKRISQLVERVSIANNDVLPIVALNAATTNKVTISTIQDWMQTHLDHGVTSIGITIGSTGTDISVTGSPVTAAGNITINVPTSSAANRGLLSAADWSTFNNKVGTARSINTTAPLQGGGDLSANRTLSITQAGVLADGYLSSVDWNTFNNKQPALGYTPVNQTRELTINGTTYNLSADRTWNVGTVTSIGVSMPSAFTVSNSPITGAGTIAITGAGNSTQYIDGTGSLQTFPSIVGNATNLIREVYNDSGATMTKGTIVYINGGQGNLPTIAKALATGDSTSAQTYGVVRADIGNMSNGYITVVGDLMDMPTNGFAVGTQLYLSGTTAGAFTSTKPYAPIHLVYVGIVTRSHPTQGVIAIKIQNGYEMDELHNVAAHLPNDGDILKYVSSTGLWTKTAGSTTNITEGTNLYYTDARARTAISETVTGLDYNSSTGVLSTSAGYGIPTTASQTNWDAAYNDKINSAAVTGTTTKTLTLTQQDGGTITASWTDINTDAVSSVFGRTGAVVAVSGDYNTDLVTEGTTNLYFTNARARSAISLTTTGSSGAATYVSGVLNVPNYTLAGLGGEPAITAGTTAQYWRGDKSWQTLNTTNVVEGTNLYFTNARSRSSISLTTTGTSGAATYNVDTGVLNIPSYVGGVTSVFGRTGAVVAASGDYTTTQVTEGTNLYYTDARARAAITGTSPISVSAGVVSIQQATALQSGFLSSADWVTFNNKQGAITLTTTGTSGAATFSSGTLNIPNYTFAETDTLQSVILRNGTTNTGFVITNGNSTYTVPSNTNVPVIYMLNTGANPNAHAVISLRTLGETGGDPFISLDINGVLGWSVGVDNSDGDKFKIGKSWAEVGINTYFTIDTSGNSTFAGSVRAAGLISKDYLILEASNSTNNWYLYTYTDNTLRFNYGGAGGDEFIMTTGGGLTILGNFTAANYSGTHSGSSSGTNTGDQDLSGYVTLGTAQTISGAKTFSNDVLVLGGRVNISTGGANTYGVVSGYSINNNHQMTMRANITGPTSNPTYTAGHQMCFVEYANNNDTEGWFFKSSAETNYTEVARITRAGINWNGNTVLHSGNYNNYAPTKTGGGASGTWSITSGDSNALGGVGPGGYTRRNYTGFTFPTGSYTGWYRIARSGQQNGGSGARGAFKIYVCATGNYLNPAQDEICGLKDWATGLYIASVTGYGGTPFQNYRLTYDSDFTYLEGYISYYFGGDQGFDVVSMDNGFSGMTWVPMTTLTASTTSSGAVSIGKVSGGTAFPYIRSGGGLFTGVTEFTGVAQDNVGLVRIVNTQSGNGEHFPALQVINVNGNHSYGIIAEFRTQNVDTGDRPSILFSRGGGPNWQFGMGAYSGNSDRFGIGYRSTYLPDTWPSMRMDMDTSGNVTFAGDVTAFSDARLKTDVQVIDNAIEKVKQIRGVTFKRNDEIDHNVGRKHTGVIAQEVLNVLPEVVSMSDTGMYNVAYGNMVGLLVEAIKEQQKEIDKLKKQIA